MLSHESRLTLYVARSNSPRVVSIGFHAGARVPAHVVSPGWVLVAAMEPGPAAEWVARHDFGRFTASTVVDREGFLEQLAVARRQGYWVSVGALDAGLSGVAIALRDRHGDCKAALGMTLQTAHWPLPAITERLLTPLLETAQVLRGIL